MKYTLTFSIAILFLLPTAESAFAQREAGPDRWETFEQATRLLVKGRNYEGAGVPAREMVKTAEETYGSFHEKVATSLNTLAAVYVLEGRVGFHLYLAALDIWETIPAPDPQGLKTTVTNLRALYDKRNMTRERNALLKRAGELNERMRLKQPAKKPASTVPNQFTILSRPVPAEEDKITEYWAKLNRAADDLRRAKDWKRAEAVAKEAVKVIQTSQYPNEFPRVSSTLTMLAQIYMDQGKGALAEPLLERALKIVETVFERHDKTVVYAIDLLAKAYEVQGKHQQANELRTGAPPDALPEIVIGTRKAGTEIGDQAWARLVNNAPLITRSQRGALFGKVNVHLSRSTGKGVDAVGFSAVRTEINRYLKQKGIVDTITSETTLFVHYHVAVSTIIRNERPSGKMYGIAVEARLVRRGFIFHDDTAYPVVAVLARWLSYGAATDPSKIDTLSHVRTAVNSVYGRDPFPRVEGPETATLINAKGVLALLDSRISFHEATRAHLNATIAGATISAGGLKDLGRRRSHEAASHLGTSIR